MQHMSMYKCVAFEICVCGRRVCESQVCHACVWMHVCLQVLFISLCYCMKSTCIVSILLPSTLPSPLAPSSTSTCEGFQRCCVPQCRHQEAPVLCVQWMAWGNVCLPHYGWLQTRLGHKWRRALIGITGSL